jgi:hypothetical protein
MAIDPGRQRYPGSRDPSWWQDYQHFWLRRFERSDPNERRRVWTRFKRRLTTLFNPRWLP